MLELCNLFLCEGFTSSCYGLHHLAELLTHDAEVTLHLLFEHVAFHEFELLHIHFVENELLHRFEVGLHVSVVDGDRDALEGLTHDDAFLLTQ